MLSATDQRIFKENESDQNLIRIIQFSGDEKRERYESWNDLEAEENGGEVVQPFRMAKKVERSLQTLP